MADGWVEWRIDREAGELVGPCGCRESNTFDGLLATRTHQCSARALGIDRDTEAAR